MSDKFSMGPVTLLRTLSILPVQSAKHLGGMLDAGGIRRRHHGSLLGLLHIRLLQMDAVYAL